MIEKHYHAFEKIEYVKTFKSLKMRYDQSEDTSLSDSAVDGCVITMQTTTIQSSYRYNYVAGIRRLFIYAWSDITLLIAMCCTLLLWLCCSTPTVLGGAGGRFRRETRTLEEEEEMWFDQDEYDEPDSLQLPDVLKPKQDLSLDQFINRYFHDRKSYFGDGGAAGEWERQLLVHV